MKNLVQVQNAPALRDRLGREVFMYSITLRPEQDIPKVLKEYAKTYRVRPGWDFLTGNAKDINELRRKLGFFNSDPKLEADPKQHTGMIKIFNDALHKTESTSVLSKPNTILKKIQRVESPKPPQ
jgi:protein SCO1